MKAAGDLQVGQVQVILLENFVGAHRAGQNGTTGVKKCLFKVLKFSFANKVTT